MTDHWTQGEGVYDSGPIFDPASCALPGRDPIPNEDAGPALLFQGWLYLSLDSIVLLDSLTQLGGLGE